MSDNLSDLTVNLIFAIAVTTVGSGFQHGYHSGVINCPAEIIKLWIDLLIEESNHNTITHPATVVRLWGIATSLMNFGGIIGAILTAVVSVKLGPKKSLLFNNLLAIVASILMGIAEKIDLYPVFMVGRLIIGVNCGLNAGLCPLFLLDISPEPLREVGGTVYRVVIAISILFAQILSHEYLIGNKIWHQLFFVGLPFAILQVITLFFCAESPRHLVTKGDNAAEKALKFYRESDNVSSELSQIKSEEEASNKLTLREMLKSGHYRKPLCIAMVLMMAQQFSGINAIIFYSTSTFMSAGFDEEYAQFGTIGVGVVNVFMTLASILLVGIFGRRTLLLIGFAGMAVTILLLPMALQLQNAFVVFPYMCIFLVYVYVSFFAVGVGSVPWLLVSEMFGQEAKTKAMLLVAPFNWFANSIITLIFPIAEYYIGPFVFLIFVALNVLFFLFIAIAVPETKNKTIEEIASKWK